MIYFCSSVSPSFQPCFSIITFASLPEFIVSFSQNSSQGSESISYFHFSLVGLSRQSVAPNLIYDDILIVCLICKISDHVVLTKFLYLLWSNISFLGLIWLASHSAVIIYHIQTEGQKLEKQSIHKNILRNLGCKPFLTPVEIILFIFKNRLIYKLYPRGKPHIGS